MTERGPIFDPRSTRERGLTSSSQRPYANDGVLSMDNINQEQRVWDPIDTPVAGGGNTGERRPPQNQDIVARTPQEVAAKAAWRGAYGGIWPTDPEERRHVEEFIRNGLTPDALRGAMSQGGVGQRHPEQGPQSPGMIDLPDFVTDDEGNVYAPLAGSELAQREAMREAMSAPGIAIGSDSSEGLLRKNQLSAQEFEQFQRDLEKGKWVPEKFLRDKDVSGDLKINSVETLAYLIMDKEQDDDFKPGGAFELLNKKGEFQSHNFLHWVRNWMMYWHGEAPDAKHDFVNEINVTKDFGALALKQMIQSPGRFFRSWRAAGQGTNEDFQVYKELVEQIKRETWLFGASREFDIGYKENMGAEEQLAKVLQQIFYLNPFTKTVWDQKSSLYWIMNMPQRFKNVPEGGRQGDSNAGRALNTAYLVYYNIADEKMLTSLLGENTSLLNREALKHAVKKQMVEEKMTLVNGTVLDKDCLDRTKFTQSQVDAYINQVSDDDIVKYLSPENLLELNGKKDITDFINIFNQPQKSSRIQKVVRTIIQDELIKKYDLYVKDVDGNYVYETEIIKDVDGKPTKDEYGNYRRREVKHKAADGSEGERVRKKDTTTVSYANTFALSMARWTGAAARNDTFAVGFDAWSKLQNTEEYRAKQASPTRIGAFGNPKTLHMFKQLATDMMNGTMVMDGKMSIEVLEDMLSASEGSQEDYYKASSQLVFADNTMRSFTVDHMNRVFAIYGQIMNTEEIKLEKFVKHDLLYGLQLERGAFEKALKENFFKPMRYAWSTYAGLDLSKMVRTHNPSYKEYRKRYKEGDPRRDTDPRCQPYMEVHLAEAMFGRELLDIEAFWHKEKDAEGNEIKDKDGHAIVRKDIKDIKIDAKNWVDKIDWSKLASKEHKHMLWRRAAWGRIAAEIHAHRDRHSSDPKYNDWIYNEVIEALETIGDGVGGDEFNMQKSREQGKNLSEEEIQWMRKKAGITEGQIMRRAFFMDLLLSLKDTFKDVGKASIKGVKP
ncbi:MAG: hypothetical protein HZC02_05015 [Candidatus Levybacteria bacterium]|nr:hypothetical protein [Candidatus Levybacteria bacterium]